MNKEQMEIYEEFSYLVKFIVDKKYGHYFYLDSSYTEDLIQVGYIGLWKGVKTYDDTKGASLKTYLYTMVSNEIGMLDRRNPYRKAQKYNIGVNVAIDTFTNDSWVGTYNYIDSDIEFRRLFYNNVLGLANKINSILINPRNNDIFWSIIKGVTQRDIATKYNLTQSYVCRIQIKNLKLLRKELKSYYDEFRGEM